MALTIGLDKIGRHDLEHRNKELRLSLGAENRVIFGPVQIVVEPKVSVFSVPSRVNRHILTPLIGE